MLQRIALEEAQACIALHLAACQPKIEQVALDAASGRTLAQALRAPFALPRFCNSAVDGFAFAHASLASGNRLRLAAHVAAGTLPANALQPGQCAAINTGAALPPGADTVAMLEDCSAHETSVTLKAAITPGQWVRQAGEEFKPGDLVIRAGERLDAARIALAASFGLASLRCYAAVRVVVLASGDELLAPDGQTSPQGAQIFDANRALLQALLQDDGAQVFLMPLLPDDPSRIEAALLQAAEHADLIISTGGASAGSADWMPRLIQKLGGLHFWRVRIKPGMPTLFGHIQGVPILALPGNPVSVQSSYLLLARAALQRLSGREPQPWLRIPVQLAQAHHKEHARREFARAMVCLQDGTLKAHLLRAQASHRLSSLLGGEHYGQAQMHAGLLDLPEGAQHFAQNAILPFTPFAGLLP
jgi:molybdopterin molybdotransferase